MRAALVVLAIALAASPALGDAKRDADARFEEGKRLLDAKKYAQACVAFEDSDRLDPAIGTKLNAAKCYEDWGRLARAYAWYVAAAELAASSKDERLPQIRELIETLDPDVPRLMIKVPAQLAPGDIEAAAIKLDGTLVPPAELGVVMRLDPGPHELVYFIDGERQSKRVPLERGGERELLIAIPEGSGARHPIDPTTGEPGVPGGAREPLRPGRTRRILALSLGAAGVAGIGVASYLTLDARGAYNDALDAHCGGMTDGCTTRGIELTKDARSQANLATVITIASVAAIGTGVYLYLTAPEGGARAERRAVYVTPVVTDRGGGIVLGGGF